MLIDIYKKLTECRGISTDSRKVGDGVMFFALKGGNFNGNLFAKQALDKGAYYAVIDEEMYIKDDRYILVDDVLTCFQELAHHHRKQFDIPVLAITGSNGKTTTKELIHSVLSKKLNVLYTEGNLNNHIGVPLTLFRMTEENEVAIIEMGANKIGDIQELCDIAMPNHGLITNIGKAHIEGFGGFEGVIRGKSELYDYLIKHNGKIFVNGRDDILMNMSKRIDEPVIYGVPEGYFDAELLHAEPFIEFSVHDTDIKTHLIGSYNFENILAALTLGKYFGVDEKSAVEAVAGYAPVNNRSQVIKTDSNTIILDAYNANPSSMEAAIENLLTFKGAKGLILGDMFELGPSEIDEHHKLGSLAASTGVEEIIFCGKLMAHAHRACPGSDYFETREELEAWLEDHHFQGLTFLIKGSRGMGLEHLLQFFKED